MGTIVTGIFSTVDERFQHKDVIIGPRLWWYKVCQVSKVFVSSQVRYLCMLWYFDVMSGILFMAVTFSRLGYVVVFCI